MKIIPASSVPDVQVQENAEPIVRPLAEGSSERRRSAVPSYTGFSTRLLILNGLAIFAAILNHAAVSTYTVIARTPEGFDQIGTLTYYSLRLVEQAVIFAIPAFFFISGYFISFAIERLEGKKQWIVVLSRIKNLIIPFLIWSVLIMLLQVLRGQPYSIGSFLLTLFTAQAAGPYYFVLTLVQYLILSPFLVALARKNYKLLLILTAVIQLVIVTMRYDTLLGLHVSALQPIHFIDSQRFFPSRIFFFTFGIVYGLRLSRSSEFKKNVHRYKWILLTSLVVFFFLGVMEWEFLQGFPGRILTYQLETHMDGIYALLFLLCFIAFEAFVPPFAKQFVLMGGMSYGIYLTHWPIQEYIAKFIFHYLPWLLSYQIIMQPILITCGLGIPILLMNLVNKSPFRQYYRYLFG